MSDSPTSLPWILHVHCRETHRKKLMAVLVVFLPILFLNGILLIILLRKFRQLSVGNAILLHLIAAECVLSLTVVPNLIVLLVGSPLANPLCQFAAFSARFSHTATMYLITILTTARCYGVLKPFEYRANIFPSRIHKICALAWCWALFCALIPVVGWGEYESNGRCFCSLDTNKHPYSWMFYCSSNYILPIVINTVAFISTAKTIKSKLGRFKVSNHAQNLAVSLEKPSQLQLLRSKRKKQMVFDEFKIEDVCTVELSNERKISLNSSSKSVQESTVDNKLTVEVDIELDPTEKHSSAQQQKIAQRNYSKQNQRKRKIEPHLQNIECEVENTQSGRKNENILVIPSCSTLTSHTASSNCPSSVQDSENFEQPGEIMKEHEINSPNIAKRKMYELEIQAREDAEESSPEEKKQLPHQQSHSHMSSKKDMQVLKIALFFACYVLFYCPTAVVRSWYAVMPEDVPRIAFAISQILPAVNSLINPFLYGYLSEEIRHDTKQLFLYVCAKCNLASISSN